MSVVVQIADAITESLNEAAFPGVTAVRRFQPTFTREQLTELKVSVVPKALAIAKSARSRNADEIGTDVALHKRVSVASQDSEVAALLDLAESMMRWLSDPAQKRLGHAVFDRIESEPIYDPESLRENTIFFAVFTVYHRID